MVTASWNGAVIAQSDDTVVVEGNHYFPRDAVDAKYLEGAHYHSIITNGKTNTDAAWYYADPKDAASEIKDRIAFWKGVEVR
jgi:uncharacterized protein (DUF427 family)